MSKRVGVVIPTYNAAATLAGCLESLRTQRHQPDRIVVVDGGSTDSTCKVARDGGASVLTTQANRSLQRNVGAQHVDTDYVVFIDADMLLPPDVISTCELWCQSHDDIALVIPETSVGTAFWTTVKSFERTFYQHVWWMEAARWFRMETFTAVGGYDVRLIGGEDWDIDERVRRLGMVGRVDTAILHQEGNVSLRGIVSKKQHYAETLKLYAELHPERARRQFRLTSRIGLFLRRPGSLLLHPRLTIGVAILGVVELLAAKRPEATPTVETPFQ